MKNKYSMPEGEKYGQRGVILYFSPSCIRYSNQQARARKNLARGKMILFPIMLKFFPQILRLFKGRTIIVWPRGKIWTQMGRISYIFP
jgi:hypothetical protein